MEEISVNYLHADIFFFQAEDGIRDVERSRGLGDVYKRQNEGLLGRQLLDTKSVKQKQGTDL